MSGNVHDEVDTKIRYAAEVVAASLSTLCRCKIQGDTSAEQTPLIPADADYVVFGHPSDPGLLQATTYLRSLGLRAKSVDVDTVPDECRTFDTAFLPVVLNVKTGGLFISNPATSRKGFDAWRSET